MTIAIGRRLVITIALMLVAALGTTGAQTPAETRRPRRCRSAAGYSPASLSTPRNAAASVSISGDMRLNGPPSRMTRPICV